jgi:hypothetical protein
MTRTHDDPAKPWVDYPCNACNGTICGGNRDQTCGGASGKAWLNSVRALRVIEYTCASTQQEQQPPRQLAAAPPAGALEGPGGRRVLVGAGDGQLTEANYTERLNIGYRWYDRHAVTPNYAFGHGLSYTEFEYSSIKVLQHAEETESGANGTMVASSSNGSGDGAVSVSVSLTLKNNGSLPGAEVVQVYLAFPSTADEPPQQLKGFAKHMLAPVRRSRLRIYSIRYHPSLPCLSCDLVAVRLLSHHY